MGAELVGRLEHLGRPSLRWLSQAECSSAVKGKNERLVAFIGDPEVPAEKKGGPLAGLVVVTKDMFHQRGLKTLYGCEEAFKDAAKETHDAAVVALFRERGATMVGKATMTELALFAPAPCANPIDASRTAGGSSCGSAVAVRTGMADCAIGSQTAGSICRPAAFNGVVGFKPSYNLLPVSGALCISPSLDTVGYFTRTAHDARTILAALLGADEATSVASGKKIVVGEFRGDRFYSPRADPCAHDCIARFKERIQGAAAFVPVDFPPSFDPELAHALYMFEAAQNVAGILGGERLARLSPGLQALLSRGASIPLSKYLEARRMAEAARREMDAAFSVSGADVLLCLNTIGVAPKLDKCLGTQWPSGSPFINAALTLFGVPCLSLPVARDGESGMPLSVQLAAPRFSDLKLLDHACDLLTRGS